MESVRLACLIGGGYRVAFGALTFVGVQFPASLIPHHSSQETPGLLAFGAASVSLLADAGLGPKFLASGCLGLWTMAAAQIQSRGTVIATLVGGAVGVLVACRERKQRLATAIVLMVLCCAAGMALVEAPLARKFAGGFREIWPSTTTGTLDLSRVAIDSLLSRRLLIWDWTVNGVEQAPIQGHGAGSWQANFRSAIDANKGLGLVSWQSGSKPMTAQRHAHDLFLQVTYEYGLIGLGLLMTCLVMWGTSIWRHPDPSSRCFGMVLLLSLVISRLNGQGDLDSRVSALMFVAVAALASGAMLSRQGLPSTNAPSCGHDCPG
jgi:O-antigen ligase